jgi:serine phosphatase RsbU (regulator of sigma subunit)
MEINSCFYKTPHTAPVFLIGENKRKAHKLSRELEKEALKCLTVHWNDIQVRSEGIYVLCTPPRKKHEKQLYNKLIDENKYIISLFKIHNGRKKFYDHVLCIPAVNDTNILKNIILWTLSRKTQELRLKQFREELRNRTKEWISEIALANELQKSLLPRNISGDLPINFAHRYLPHAYIGGDFFDIIRFDEKRVGIIIADVSGHGTAAAFITAMFKSALLHFAEKEDSPARLLLRLNDEFNDHIRGHYITAFYAMINIENMSCTYCNAGHPRQLLIHSNGRIEELKPSGFFIGMFKDIMFEDRVITLVPGDRLIFFTDGVIEVKNNHDEPFGLKNLKKYIKRGINETIIHLSNQIIDKVIMHMKDNRLPDDLTLLIAEMIEDI